ncbi:hypothetical protein GCM10010329_77690 [Streptomyces spiroverticillatus]|uniref:Uncharacterized protein n=1 Tax=Streptomyces finlayi TaxID=67296 RepID=A0A918X5B5_9ACTN|nr:hypothetical protein GCM10010329_77690 [Streptomyces spiroverticillatus]GHD13453.1 hypothetical protein GCM10010334_71660 [Streptomyces finlayi]
MAKARAAAMPAVLPSYPAVLVMGSFTGSCALDKWGTPLLGQDVPGPCYCVPLRPACVLRGTGTVRVPMINVSTLRKDQVLRNTLSRGRTCAAACVEGAFCLCLYAGRGARSCRVLREGNRWRTLGL